jgi:hypothetical protein
MGSAGGGGETVAWWSGEEARVPHRPWVAGGRRAELEGRLAESGRRRRGCREEEEEMITNSEWHITRKRNEVGRRRSRRGHTIGYFGKGCFLPGLALGSK